MILDDADWPRFGWTADLRPALADARRRGASIALATIVALEGSSPRPVGTQMVFEGTKAAGYFSGGCLEADVAAHAAATLETGVPRVLTYGQGSPWIDIRLTCGGRLDILVERVAPEDDAVAVLLDAREQRRAVVWRSDGRQRSVVDGLAAATWRSGLVSLPFLPPRRLLIAGGDPTGLAIAELGTSAGLETMLLRPDLANGATDRRLTAVAGLASSLSLVGAADPWTAVAVATHDGEIDHQLLRAALSGEAGYVGVLGATARLPERMQRLADEGLDPGRLQQLHAPMGAARTGKTPWEVAVSVIAEIMAVFDAQARTCD